MPIVRTGNAIGPGPILGFLSRAGGIGKEDQNHRLIISVGSEQYTAVLINIIQKKRRNFE